jgi:hypothetical protein
VLRRVSAGTRALTLARDVNALGFLGYFEDGEQIVGFEVLTPQERSGREPDRFLEAMHRHGLLPPGDSGEFLAVARLAANEIGVSLEREVFERAELISATVLPLLDDPEPDAPGAADLERAAAEARRVLGDEPAARTVVELALTQKAEAAVLVGDEAPFGLLARRLRAEWYRMAVGQNDPQARHLVPDDAQRERIGRRHRAAQELRRALLAVTAESAATEAAPCGPVIELDDPAAKARWQAEGAAPGTVFTFTPRPRRGANGPRPWRPGSGRDR